MDKPFYKKWIPCICTYGSRAPPSKGGGVYMSGMALKVLKISLFTNFWEILPPPGTHSGNKGPIFALRLIGGNSPGDTGVAGVK